MPAKEREKMPLDLLYFALTVYGEARGENKASMPISENFSTHFVSLTDPRKNNHNKHHKLGDILIITILAVICGADSWVEIEEFGKDKIEWLKTFLELPHRIPSHDTIGDLFARLSIREFENCFLSWINSLVKVSGGDIIPSFITIKNLKQMRGDYEVIQQMQKYCCGQDCDASNCVMSSFTDRNQLGIILLTSMRHW